MGRNKDKSQDSSNVQALEFGGLQKYHPHRIALFDYLEYVKGEGDSHDKPFDAAAVNPKRQCSSPNLRFKWSSSVMSVWNGEKGRA